MEALGHEFPWGAIGKKPGFDHFLVGWRRSRSRFGFWRILARGFGRGRAGGFRRRDKPEILGAQDVGSEGGRDRFPRLLNNGGMVDRFATGCLIEVEDFTEKRIRRVTDRPCAKPLVVEKYAEDEDFGFGDVRGFGIRGPLGRLASGRAFEVELLLRCGDAQLLADTEEVRFQRIEFLQLGDREAELFCDADEDIAFFHGVGVVVQLLGGEGPRCGVLLQDGDFPGR